MANVWHGPIRLKWKAVCEIKTALFSCSVTQFCLTLCEPIDCIQTSCPSPSPRVCSNSCRWSQWCHPTISSSVVPFSSCLQFSPESGSFLWLSSSHQVAKILELQLQHQSSKEYSGLISFRIDWFDLHAVHGTLKCLLQYHSLKASILWCSAFFMVQSHIHHDYWKKKIVLIVCTFVGN